MADKDKVRDHQLSLLSFNLHEIRIFAVKKTLYRKRNGFGMEKTLLLRQPMDIQKDTLIRYHHPRPWTHRHVVSHL